MEKLKIILGAILGIILGFISLFILSFTGIGKYLGAFGFIIWIVISILFIYLLVTRKKWKRFIGTFLLIMGIEFMLLLPVNFLAAQQAWVRLFL